MAKICKEKVAGRAGCPSKTFDEADRSHFGVRLPHDVIPKSLQLFGIMRADVADLAGYFVAKDLKMNHISCAFASRIQPDRLTPFLPV